MDNYDLSNLPLSGRCADSGKHHSLLTDEENRRATFSGRSAIVSTSEQVERQQLPSTGDEQIPEQRVLASIVISLAPTTSAATATTIDDMYKCQTFSSCCHCCLMYILRHVRIMINESLARGALRVVFAGFALQGVQGSIDGE